MSKLSEKDLFSVGEKYRKRIQEFGLGFDSLKSGSVEKQNMRHKVHASSIKTEYPSVLDIGSGLGDFYNYLKSTNQRFQYTGYDIVSEYVDFCNHNYKEAKFYKRNVFDDGIGGEFDNIVLSQVLNNRYETSDNMEVMKEMMSICFQHCKVGISIDMMSEYVDFKNDELFYYSPEKIFSHAKSLTKRVLLRHDHRPFEFCIQLFKMDAPDFVW
ncbi:MAG: methyltransferase domain-containing protein [Bacteroidota bacterium]|jgi:SAM-dependent methyltransferase